MSILSSVPTYRSTTKGSTFLISVLFAAMGACASPIEAGSDGGLALEEKELLSCTTPGPCWVDQQTVNVGGNSAFGRTGQWWCTNHFANNLGGYWECIEGTASHCSETVPTNGNVQCGRFDSEGATPYLGAGVTKTSFGYGRVERLLVGQYAPGRTGRWWCANHFGNNYGGSWKCRDVSGNLSCEADVPNGELVSCSQYLSVQSVGVSAPAPGRTGQWWCTNHFGANLGGTWDCLSVAGGSCSADAPSGASVTCGRYNVVDESAFAPQSCNAPSMHGAETAFCDLTEYMSTRKARTAYLFNDHLRAGFNRSFGGTIFELYGNDKRNRIEEHGGSAMQLSVWGYDNNGTGTGFFTTQVCSSTPYADPSLCAAANGGVECRPFSATGAHISNCSTEFPCNNWTAGAPWNPIQAQAANCAWNGPSNDVSQVTDSPDGKGITFSKTAPYHFTKTTAFSDLTWKMTGYVYHDRPYLRTQYQMIYSSTRPGSVHNQEIPALFTDSDVGYWYYYYQGTAPYTNADSPVTRLRSAFGSELYLPARAAPMPEPAPATPHAASEDWMTVCNRDETQCLTVATFAPDVKSFVQGGSYITLLGRFGLGTSFNRTWDVYVFPYRYDDVVAGKSVRKWIHDLKNGL